MLVIARTTQIGIFRDIRIRTRGESVSTFQRILIAQLCTAQLPTAVELCSGISSPSTHSCGPLLSKEEEEEELFHLSNLEWIFLEETFRSLKSIFSSIQINYLTENLSSREVDRPRSCLPSSPTSGK